MGFFSIKKTKYLYTFGKKIMLDVANKNA